MASQRTLLHGAIVLIIAGFINRVIGFLYRIFAVRVVGPEGIGLYEMVIPVYTLLLVVTTAGVPLAISKLVAEQVSLGNIREVRKIFRVSLVFLICAGSFSVLLLLCSISFLVGNIFSDPRVYWCLLTLAPAILITSISSAFRGYYQGLQEMVPPALGQVLEQIVRVSVGVYLATSLLPYGTEYAVAGLACGTVLGETSGLLFLIFMYASKKKQVQLNKNFISRKTSSTAAILSSIFTFAIPVSFSRLINSLLLTLQAILIPLRLQAAGHTLRQATEIYGQFSGIALALLGLPSIITFSLATTLVPATSEAMAKNNLVLLKVRCKKALQVSLIVGLPAAIVFFLLSTQLCQIIFNTPQAGIPLRILSFGCIFLYLAQTSSGILQGLGRVGTVLGNSIAGAVCNIIFIFLLTGLPTYGIRGTAIAMNIGWAIIAVLNLYSVSSLTGVTFSWRDFFIIPLLGSIFTGGIIYCTFTLFWSCTANKVLATIGAILAGAVVYVAYLFLSGTVKKDDLARLPGMGYFFHSIL